MKVAGFSFIKNAVKNDYPIVEAITSILPICDEFVIAVGKCDDGTRELIENINSPKIKIIDTIWDDNLNEGGRVLAQETDKAFDAISKDMDWAFYIQGDECVHEKYLDTIKNEMQQCLNQPKVEGLLFKYKHFYGSYDYYAESRKWYRREIRIVRRNLNVKSWGDAQGFRIDGRKLNVYLIDAEIYHYGWVKPPELYINKFRDMHKLYHKTPLPANLEYFEYYNADNIIPFKDSHPTVIKKYIERKNWNLGFDPNKVKAKNKLKNIFLFKIEQWFGVRLFEYKNYKKC